MVIANQMWMLQRMLPVIKACTSKETVREWMKIFQNAEEVLNLKEIIGGFKIEKRGGKLFSASDKS